jgi:hypothetical protein
MDHHQGDGYSLLHQVASCYIPATLKTVPHSRDGEGFFSLPRIGLNCQTRYEVKTPAVMGGSSSATWPMISINHHATTGKQTRLVPATLKKPFLIGGTAGLISQSRVGLNCQTTRYEVKTLAAMGGSASAIWPAESQLTTMQLRKQDDQTNVDAERKRL